MPDLVISVVEQNGNSGDVSWSWLFSYVWNVCCIVVFVLQLSCKTGRQRSGCLCFPLGTAYSSSIDHGRRCIDSGSRRTGYSTRARKQEGWRCSYYYCCSHDDRNA